MTAAEPAKDGDAPERTVNPVTGKKSTHPTGEHQADDNADRDPPA